MKRLILIDGNAVLHRAFHALPPLTSPDGLIVNAVYGFAAILFKIVHDLKPTHLAVAFDRPKPTFRKALYKEYQAKRPEMDGTLVPQIGVVHDLLTACKIPVFEMDGFEADDVIGTLTAQAEGNHIDQIIIVTGDRDIMQLVSDKTMVYMPVKGVTDAKLYTKEDVKERMGVAPGEIPDFKALAGDSSDNYPGVAGIGPKTASGLISRFGSVEALYDELEARPESFPESVARKLRDGKEAAWLSKDLATIRNQVPVDISWDSIAFSSLDTPEARDFLEKLHFHSLLRRFTGVEQEKSEKKVKKPGKDRKSDKTDTEQLSLV
jgi:5'-3' exonuclease